MLKNKRGFTLVELMVVIIVFAILLGMAMMSLNRFTPTYRLKESTEKIAGVYRMARARAIMRSTQARVVYTEGVDTTFAVDVDSLRNPGAPQWVREGGIVRIKGMSFTDRPNANLIFYPDGSYRDVARGIIEDTILVSNKSGKGLIYIVPLTGTVVVQFSK